MKLPLAAKLLLLSGIVLFFFGKSSAETTGRLESGIDLLERQLEMKRHEQLIDLKADPKSVLAQFTTDGCSGGLSVGWEYLAGKIQHFHAMHGTRPAWESCCVTHDRAYHTGGPREASAAESFEARRAADLALKTCVLETGMKRIPELSAEYNISPREVETLYTAIAALMYRSVRIGGMPCTGLPWCWGYGWPECE
ncbi:MAG: hypothetical protein JRF04_00210 [Deltaproteobacteria bacterium]|nr:hypothetical protein [Deltaproteobacteria bacterium]